VMNKRKPAINLLPQKPRIPGLRRVSAERKIQSGLSFFEMAEKYRSASLTIIEKVETIGSKKALNTEFGFIAEPYIFLVGHSLELYLKGFLLSRGAKHDEITAIRHSIVECAEICIRARLDINEELITIIKNIDILYNNPYSVRYPNYHSLKFFVPNVYAKALKNIRELVFPSIIAAARHGMPIV
jgi:hypothetical protein